MPVMSVSVSFSLVLSPSPFVKYCALNFLYGNIYHFAHCNYDAKQIFWTCRINRLFSGAQPNMAISRILIKELNSTGYFISTLIHDSTSCKRSVKCVFPQPNNIWLFLLPNLCIMWYLAPYICHYNVEIKT